MADPQTKRGDSKTMKKRKRRLCEPKQEAYKTPRIDLLEEDRAKEEQGGMSLELEQCHPWKNLRLILSIQDKETDVEKKVQLALNFMKSRTTEVGDDFVQGRETVSISRVVVFLNNWVQSVLISSEKKIRMEGKRLQLKFPGSCLDLKCWEIFRYCLKEHCRLNLSLSFPQDLLRAVRLIAREAVFLLDEISPNSKETVLSGEHFKLITTVRDCVLLMFSSDFQVLNENLDSWVSMIDAVLELLLKTYSSGLDAGTVGVCVLEFSCYILEPFTNYLRAYPFRKGGFSDFTDELVEPLLHLLNVLQLQINSFNPDGAIKLLSLVKEILSVGLFHSVHIDGFLIIHSVDKYITPGYAELKDSKACIKSYHRHLFNKLEKLMAERKIIPVGGIGGLFCLFVHTVKKQKGEDFLKAETRNSIFDFFVQIVEPLILDICRHIQATLDGVAFLSDVYCSLKCITSIFTSFMQEKVYVRTEDNSKGASFNFLKMVYDTVMSLSVKISQLWMSSSDIVKGSIGEILVLVAKEIIVIIGFFLEIEHEVVGNLVNLWLLLLVYSVAGSMTDAPGCNSLAAEVLNLGCHLVNLYSELRQVTSTILMLCKAMRLLVARDNDDEMNSLRFVSCIPVLLYEAFAKSVGMLLCSPDFRLSIHNAIRSIPEGQASQCIRQLTTDMTEFLEWMEIDSSVDNDTIFNLKAELLGRNVTEIYVLVLDSLTITTGNSYLIGSSMKDFVTVLRPSLSSLVKLQSDCIEEFLFAVTARNFNKDDLAKSRYSSHWVFLFFFRLYMSSRSLFRETISLMPPSSSKMMSALMGGSFASFSGKDWVENAEWTDEGYFSWIIKPSASLLSVIQSVSAIRYGDSIAVADRSPLIYTMHAMALQRLIDLNKQIKSAEYLKMSNYHLNEVKLKDDADLSLPGKERRQWKRLISCLRQEAADLSDFMMDYLELVGEQKLTKNANLSLNENDDWDLAVCSLNNNSLPTAIWWIICQNIDIWCTHVSKKKLKLFLTILIYSSLPSVTSSFGDVEGKNISNGNGKVRKVTVHQIAVALLSDTIFYEQTFVRRHLASTSCHVLKKSILSLFGNSSYGDVDFKSLPNWSEVLSAHDNSLVNISSSKDTLHDFSSGTQSATELHTGCDKEINSLPPISMDFAVCQSLLQIFCWMSKSFSNSRSFSLFASYILNFERLVVGSLMNYDGALYSTTHLELLRLLLSCRRSLKYLVMASCDSSTKLGKFSLVSILAESSFPILWLLNSVLAVIGRQSSLEDGTKEMMFSLMDVTSYVLLTVSKDRVALGLDFLVTSANKEGDLDELCVSSSEDIAASAWETVGLIAVTLKELMNSLFISLKEVYSNGKLGAGLNAVGLNKVSFLLSCFQGFLWGFASALNHIDLKTFNKSVNLLQYIDECTINILLDVIKFSLRILFSEDDQPPDSLDVIKFSLPILFREDDKQPDSSFGDIPSCSSVLTDAYSFNMECLKKPLIESFLKGENQDKAYLLRQLFLASSAVLRFGSQFNLTPPMTSSLVLIFIGISETLMLELTEMVVMPKPFSFVWLDGMLKFLEELGNHFPLTDPTSSRKLFLKMIDLHLKGIGKCISLQGKRAVLASHEMELNTKSLPSRLEEVPAVSYCLDEFKARVRMSFKVLIRKASELHLLSAIQALEKALVGVNNGCTKVYEVSMGRVSSVVAAGIDCLDLVLESVKGRKRLSMIRRHIQGLLASLFNIILHLQGSLIYCEKLVHDKSDTDPDSGSVVLMCVEALIRISGKHHMDSCHVSQSLHLPSALFQDFCHLKLSEEKLNFYVVDRRFSMELFAACCRLLCTLLKHHKSESERCIAIVQDSVSVLLHCLVMADSASVAVKGIILWEVQEGVKCASFLRRVYEELRQQKDVFGRHCFQFLSKYIWVYSGYGPFQSGIRREVDEALRPGVNALIDVCSADDLQYLHTAFGQGPCQSTLANLQHDYKLNFQYGGKV